MTIYREITRREEIEIPVERIEEIRELSTGEYVLTFKDAPIWANFVITKEEYTDLRWELYRRKINQE